MTGSFLTTYVPLIFAKATQLMIGAPNQLSLKDTPEGVPVYRTLFPGFLLTLLQLHDCGSF